MEFKENLLYEIHCNADSADEGFDIGYFVIQDDEFVIFKTISVNGFDDGLIMVRLDGIHKLLFNTKYCISLDKIIKHQQTKIETPKFKEKNLMKEVLNYAKENKSIVGFELNNSGYIDLRGFITEITDDCVMTAEIDVDGFIDGNGICKISDIDYIDVDAYKTQKFKILFNINYPSGLPKA